MEQEIESGSTEYITDRKYDVIVKKYAKKIDHAIHVSVERLTKTKKQLVRECAVELEKAGYPVDQICLRITRSFAGKVHHSTVSEALDAKYKDPTKMMEGSKNKGRSEDPSDREKLLKKPYKQIDGNDILNNKGALPKAILEKVATYQMDQVEYWKQQLKQEFDTLYELYKQALDSKITDAELGKQFRKEAREFMKQQKKQKE